MKIVYLADINPENSSGVFKKILSQANCWRHLGHQVEVILITNFLSHKVIVDTKFFCMRPKFLPKQFGNYINRILSYISLNKLIKSWQPDIIYYRQSIWVPGLASIFSLAPSVMELNSDDLSEKKSIGLGSWIYCKLTREKIIKNVTGLVAVSQEIGDLYKEYQIPIAVISNGYDFSNLKTLCYQPQSRKQLIFVGSPNQDWHGLDKIIRLAKLLKEFDFNIVGFQISCELSNVVFHGYMDHFKLLNLYQKMDIGIGTLALHRKSMQEASPLKVREYLAYGLPVIIGYRDSDLHDLPFILSIDNCEKNIENAYHRIRNFVNQWAGTRVARTDVESLISWHNKERLRLDFLSRLLLSVDKK